MPAPPPDDELLGSDPQGNRDLDRYAEDSLDSGLAVAQGNLYISAVEAGGEGRRGKKLGLGAWLAIGWLVFVVAVSALAQLGVLPLKSPTEPFAECARLGPFAKEGTAPGHLLGCDSNGRDMIARLAYGGWSSLVVAVGAVVFGLVFGGTLGLLAGYFGGKVDAVLTSLFNVFLAIPAVVLALSLVAFLQGASAAGGEQGQSLDPKVLLIIAIGIVSVPLLGRITRASALTWTQREFVLAARAQGAKPLRIMIREVLPNVIPAMMSIALLAIAIAIVAEGTLSVLGVGVKPPTPSWGNIISLDRGRIRESPHIVFEPAVLIFLTVLSLNFLGDVVRARLDVRESAV